MVSATHALAVAVGMAAVLTAGACQKFVGIHDYRRDAGSASGGSGGRGGAAGPGGASGVDGTAGRGGSGFDSGPPDVSMDAQGSDARSDGSQLLDGRDAGDAGPGLKACPSPTTYWTGIAYRLSSGPHSAGNGQGECGFPNAELPSGMAYAAVDHTLFNSMPTCGACLHVEHVSDSRPSPKCR